MRKINTILLDMDNITVDMLPCWLRQYWALTGEKLVEANVTQWDAPSLVKHPEIMEGLLELPGFFYNLPIMPYAKEYINKLIADGYEVIFLTQPPRRADHAVKDKRAWILSHFPKFDMTNVIFAHKKYLIKGDVLFDDRPTHLNEWKKHNPQGIAAMIEYPYNTPPRWNFVNYDWSFKDKSTAWEEFYNLIKKNS